MISVLLAIFFLQFTDKGGSDCVALSPTAIVMREERGIAIDSLDYAVSEVYLDSIRALGGKVLHTSRWLNGATVEGKSGAKAKWLACSFVDTIYQTRTDKLPTFPMVSPRHKQEVKWTDSIAYGETKSQLEVMNLPRLHEAGYHGQGIRIGIADGGFANADSLGGLAAVRGQWLGYADLTDDKTDIFDAEHTHGTMCLSTIVGKQEDYWGAATAAEYYLFRTEEQETESLKEIDNWVAAVEMADSMGLHIVSTSLGYRLFDDEKMDFEYAEMDGYHSRGAQAAVIAARKGMLLVVAMGNDGTNEWHYLSTPADADSIVSVGAVSGSGSIASFSSYGPSSDGRVKPEVCAQGVHVAVLNPNDSKVVHSDGTSFACPLIAGMAACLWSAMPEATNMQIREYIIRSANRWDSPNDRHGYGIPDVWKAYTNANTGVENTTSLEGACVKIMKNGELYIIRQGSRYNLLGHKIE